MKRKDTKPVAGTEGSEGKPGMIAVKDIHTHPMFVDLLPVDGDLLEKMILDMRAHGFYESEPIVLGTWPGLEEPVLIDGHMRIRAASKNGITDVPFVPVDFESQMAALQHAMNLQAVRRRSTDGAFYRLCEQYDTLMERGRHKEDGEEKELLTGVSNFVGRSASARRTAQLIGCNCKKADKIRKIRRDGTPEIQEDVSNDRMSINKTYKLIRDMELGIEEKGEKLSAAQIKAVKTLFTEVNFTALQELDGNLHSLVNLAIEQFISGLRGNGHAGNK